MSSEDDHLGYELELMLARYVITSSYHAAFGDGSKARADAREEPFLRAAAQRALLNVEWEPS
jgi:hypothetical protein